jgi:beta-fructofuranosidase
MNPPAEIERLRYLPKSASNLRVESGGELMLAGIRGNSLELEIEMSAPEAREFGVKVCVSPGGEEQTRIYYDAAERKLKIDATKSGGDSPKTIEGGPLVLLKLRVFVDKSVVEVFANEGRQAVMRRIYPARVDSLNAALFSEGAPAQASVVRSWQIAPSNPF